jgi:hypothetical protein
MRRTLMAAAAVAALTLAVAGGAEAQSGRPDPASLVIGAEVDGALTGRDLDTGAYRYDDYVFEAVAGQRLEATLESGDFDAFLEIFGEGETDGEALAWDDDGLGDGLDSRLRYTVPYSGRFVLRARTLSGLDGGDYRLTLTERPPAPPAPEPKPLRLDDPVAGELGDGDPVDDDGAAFDAFVYTADAGQRDLITLESDDFDALLLVGREVGGSFIELERNDDGPGVGLNSRLVFTAPEAGDYVVRARALSGGADGAYRLTRTSPPPPPPRLPVEIGGTRSGELTADTPVNAFGMRADVYTFTATAGQRVQISLSSDDFDTYLGLIAADGAILDEDDDGAGVGTNSRLTHTFEADGEYVIEARAFADSGEGAYELALEAVAPPPPPMTLVAGRDHSGELTDDSPRDIDERHFQDFRVELQAGRRFQAILRSGDFDSYLRIGSAEGEFTPLAEDDDGLGEGFNSRLNFVPETDGAYILRVSPLGAGSTGLYALETLDRGPPPAPGSIIVGGVARGVLTEDDGLQDGVYFDAYRIRLKADEAIRIVMASNDFDAVVTVGPEDEPFVATASDDDSLSDTHARLDWTAPEDGVYVIRAQGFDAKQLGPYILRVEPQP